VSANGEWRMSRGRWVLVAVAAAVAGSVSAGELLDAGRDGEPAVSERAGRGCGGVLRLVDQKPWQTVAALLRLPCRRKRKDSRARRSVSPTTKVDQAFAMALRQAEMDKRVLTGPALELAAEGQRAGRAGEGRSGGGGRPEREGRCGKEIRRGRGRFGKRRPRSGEGAAAARHGRDERRERRSCARQRRQAKRDPAGA